MVKGDGTAGTRRRRARVPTASAAATAAVGQFDVVVGPPTPDDNFIKRFPLPHVVRSRHDVGTPAAGPGGGWAAATTAKITP